MDTVKRYYSPQNKSRMTLGNGHAWVENYNPVIRKWERVLHTTQADFIALVIFAWS